MAKPYSGALYANDGTLLANVEFALNITRGNLTQMSGRILAHDKPLDFGALMLSSEPFDLKTGERHLRIYFGAADSRFKVEEAPYWPGL